MSYTHIPPQLIQRIEVNYCTWDSVVEQVPKKGRKRGSEPRRRHFVKTKRHIIFDAALVDFEIYDHQAISGDNRGGRLDIPIKADDFDTSKARERKTRTYEQTRG